MVALRRFITHSRTLQTFRVYSGAAQPSPPEIETNVNEQISEEKQTDFTLENYEKGSPESGASLKHEDDVRNLMG